jgi:flagellar L-ring protein precursor FlgH
MRALLLWAIVLTSSLLAGCQTMPLPQEDAPLPVAPRVRKGQAGGVFSTEAYSPLTSDSRAFRPGDVLTVILQETTQASKKTGTTIDKNSNANVLPSVVMGSTVDTTGSVGAKRSFDSSDSSTQQNTLQGAITVVVQDVLPNGLLQIRGEKSLTLNDGEEFIRVSGYVRVSDIDTDNRLSSQRIANARIVYSGRGDLAEVHRQGWFTKFLNSSWMPF